MGNNLQLYDNDLTLPPPCGHALGQLNEDALDSHQAMIASLFPTRIVIMHYGLL